MTIYEKLVAHRQEILRLAAQHGTRRVRVFGSVARREADAESDVDFPVEMEPGRSLFDMSALLVALEELLGCRVDLVTEESIHERMRRHVLREAIDLEKVA